MGSNPTAAKSIFLFLFCPFWANAFLGCCRPGLMQSPATYDQLLLAGRKHVSLLLLFPFCGLRAAASACTKFLPNDMCCNTIAHELKHWQSLCWVHWHFWSNRCVPTLFRVTQLPLLLPVGSTPTAAKYVFCLALLGLLRLWADAGPAACDQPCWLAEACCLCCSSSSCLLGLEAAGSSLLLTFDAQ